MKKDVLDVLTRELTMRGDSVLATSQRPAPEVAFRGWRQDAVHPLFAVAIRLSRGPELSGMAAADVAGRRCGMSASSLGDILRAAQEESGLGLGELTVLSAANDPFRLDTPANHINGRWFLEQMEACGLMARANPIHNRGIHYAIVSRGNKAKLPSGKPYKNDADCWAFLEDRASKAARWLGYVPFDKIIDARNAAPIIRIKPAETEIRPYVSTGSLVDLPAAVDLRPEVGLANFRARQRYRIVLYGEKTSLGEVLGPISERYDTDLYLPSGEISDTLLAKIARTGAEDGRPMAVLVFADCDPSGYQMAVSIGHKLRALKEALHPSLTFQVLAPALTVEQVRRFDLPSTPLKDTERRGDGWRERYGVEQTEIDALATLRPELLTEIVEEACDPFFDASLTARTNRARNEWEESAQEELDGKIDEDFLEDIRERAQAALDALREQLDQAGDIDIEIDLPPPALPNAEPPENGPDPLVDSEMDLVEHVEVLRARKNYTNGGAA